MQKLSPNEKVWHVDGSNLCSLLVDARANIDSFAKSRVPQPCCSSSHSASSSACYVTVTATATSCQSVLQLRLCLKTVAGCCRSFSLPNKGRATSLLALGSTSCGSGVLHGLGRPTSLCTGENSSATNIAFPCTSYQVKHGQLKLPPSGKPHCQGAEAAFEQRWAKRKSSLLTLPGFRLQTALSVSILGLMGQHVRLTS